MAKPLRILTIDNKEDNKILREVSLGVTQKEIESREFQDFLDDLLETANTAETEEGYIVAGLAAIQVGEKKNVFCVLKNDQRDFEIMINPEIKPISDKKVVDIEACMSIPKKVGKVSRYKKIKVKYQDREGKIKKGVFSNDRAREIQHEYDHTKGILFTDKIID